MRQSLSLQRFFLAAGVLASAAFSVRASAQAAGAVPPLKHVMVVVFENMDVGEVMKRPFFAKLAASGAQLTQMYAETHPSQPNYIALTSGDLQGVLGDWDVDLDVSHIGDLLEAKGKRWRAYAEDYPGGLYPGRCFTGSHKGRYVRKHVPFLSYTNVTQVSERCANIVDAKQLALDVEAGQLPEYAFYAPNLDNDGHDTDADFADAFLAKTFGPLLAKPKFAKDLLLVVTFDEGTLFSDNQIYTVLVGDMVQPGVVYGERTDHYGLLRTIEEGLGLGTIGTQDVGAAPITGIWRRP